MSCLFIILIYPYFNGSTRSAVEVKKQKTAFIPERGPISQSSGLFRSMRDSNTAVPASAGTAVMNSTAMTEV